MVASFVVAVGIWTRPVYRPWWQMPGRSGYNYFVVSVAAVVLLNKGAAGKGYCHYRNYDGNY